MGENLPPSFKKFVFLDHMGPDSPRNFTLKESYILMRGMLPELDLDANEKTVRTHIRDTIKTTESTYDTLLLQDFEYLEACGKRLCVPAQKEGFDWSARPVKQLSGHGSIYVRLTTDIFDYEDDSNVMKSG